MRITLTSQIMREAESRISRYLNTFVCVAVADVARQGDDESFRHSGLEEQVHRLLRRDGYRTDGTWDVRFITDRASVDKRIERIQWCRKIAAELEAQEQADEARVLQVR